MKYAIKKSTISIGLYFLFLLNLNMNCTWKAIKFHKWETLKLPIDIYYTDNSEKDISWYTIKFTAKKKITDSDSVAVINKSWTTHVNPVHWKTLLSIPADETINIAPWNYYFDIKAISPSNEVSITNAWQIQVLDTVTD